MLTSFGLVQCASIAGAIEDNTERVLALISRYAKLDMLVFPEMVLAGYPPEDLLFQSNMPERIHQALEKIAAHTVGRLVVIGHPLYEEGLCYNALSVLVEGARILVYAKRRLPNFGVFDEMRYFTPGTRPGLFSYKGHTFGLMICEDGWFTEVAQDLKKAGATVLLQINASPFTQTRYEERLVEASKRIRETDLPLLSVYSVGTQDELIFDGGSFVIDASLCLLAEGAHFEEDCVRGLIEGRGKITSRHAKFPVMSMIERTYKALVQGVRDYVQHHGFEGVLIGLSGGIDSALVLAIAVDALGPEAVTAVSMPSCYTLEMSVEDAKWEAERLGVEFEVLPIQEVFEAFQHSLSHLFEGYGPDVTEENLQARTRGVLLMALSNKWRKLVLTTGNKSELAVGYSTLYGDMAGGYDVLKDVYKTQVYALAHYRNQLSLVIPERVIHRAPTAELALNQKDQDILPPYEVLDQILKYYLEDNLDAQKIIEKGFETRMVNFVIARIQQNEYKRRQAPIGPKVSSRAFGRDWRVPVMAG